eukprot:12972162-Alexandrium_andersonii.AAC.1
MQSDTVCVQEHCAPPARSAIATAATGKLGYGVVLSPTDPEAARPSGGAAVLVRRPLSFQQCSAHAEQCASAVALGRIVVATVAHWGPYSIAC